VVIYVTLLRQCGAQNNVLEHLPKAFSRAQLNPLSLRLFVYLCGQSRQMQSPKQKSKLVQCPVKSLQIRLWQIAFYAFTRSKPSLLHHAVTMPRTPLGTIDGNRRRGFELSEALRLRIAGAAENSVSPADISRNYKVPYDTVY
jgi:hypothetical protein